MSLMVVLLSLRLICCIMLTNLSRRIGMSHLTKYVKMFHLFLTSISMRSSPFTSITEKSVQGGFLIVLMMNTNHHYGSCSSFLNHYSKDRDEFLAHVIVLFTNKTTKVQAGSLNSEGYGYSLMGCLLYTSRCV